MVLPCGPCSGPWMNPLSASMYRPSIMGEGGISSYCCVGTGWYGNDLWFPEESALTSETGLERSPIPPLFVRSETYGDSGRPASGIAMG